MTEPVPGVPAWHVDPSGRHQYRWWDGSAYTDQVADDGVTTTDPEAASASAPIPSEPEPEPTVSEPTAPEPKSIPPISPVPPVPSGPHIGPPPAFEATPGSMPTPIGSPADPTLAPSATSSKSKAPMAIVGLLVVVAVIVVGFLVVGGSDGGGNSGTGELEGTVGDGDEAAGIHDVSVSGPVALTIELDPDDDLDAVIGLVVTDDDADRIEDVYRDLGAPGAVDLDEAFSAVDFDDLEDRLDGDQVVLRTDVGFAGDTEEVLLVVPFDVDLQVVVGPFEEDEAAEGDYELTIEAYDLDAEADDEAEDLLEAVEDDDDVPRAFRRLAEEQLSGGE